MGDHRGVGSVDALPTRRTNEQLAGSPHMSFLWQKPERLVVRQVIAYKISLDGLAFVPGVVPVFSRCSLVLMVASNSLDKNKWHESKTMV